jgi:hypothetical protein
MTFAIRNLSQLAYAQGFTLWHYRTADPLSEVLAPGYFDNAHDFFHLGDHMHVAGALVSIAAVLPHVITRVLARTQEDT